MPAPPPTSFSSHRHASTSTPSPADNNDPSPHSAAPSESRRSKDSEGYPTWLPKRPPPPAPASTLHSSIFAGYFDDQDPNTMHMRRSTGDSPNTAASASPDDPYPGMSIGLVGRKPTPRSVRIVSVSDRPPAHGEEEAKAAKQSASAGAVGGESSSPNKHGRTRSGVNPPPKVVTRPTPIPGPSSPTHPASTSPNPIPDLIGFTSSADPAYLASYPLGAGALPHPRFNAKNLQLGLLRNPSKWMKFYYYVWPLLVFYHVPAQTFLDFNAVYMLLQVAKFPNPNNTSKNWALGAAAYVACWLVWILVVCVLYELVYSFARRWRMRRPLILPIYLSSSAFNFAAMTSYTNFSFLMYLRFSAFWNALSEPAPKTHKAEKRRSRTDEKMKEEKKPEQRQDQIDLSVREEEFGVLTEKRDRESRHPDHPTTANLEKHDDVDSNPDSNPEDTDDSEDEQHEWTWTSALSETFYFYSQNLPTVALLLPRAGLALALIFAFSDPAPLPMLGLGFSAAQNPGLERWRSRDRTFFGADGALTRYATVVLWLNVAWAVWRGLVLLVAWLGLWILSNQRLAGLSGPRHIWEETANEKRRSRYAYTAEEAAAEWRASLYAPHRAQSLSYAAHPPHLQSHPSHRQPHTQPAFHPRAHRTSALYESAEDDIPWEWRDATRMRIQDAFMFCLVPPRRSSSRSRSRSRFGSRRGVSGYAASLRGTGTGGDLRWSTVSGEVVRIVNASEDFDQDRGRDMSYSTHPSGFEYGYGYGWTGDEPDQPGPYAYGGYGPNSRRFRKEREMRKSGEEQRERYVRGGLVVESSERRREKEREGGEKVRRDVDVERGQERDGETEALQRVLAAVGTSPSKRGALTRELFAEPGKEGIEPLQYEERIQHPHKAKRNSKDRISGVEAGLVAAPASTAPITTTGKPNAPLLALPYPFSRPGVGHVSSKDLVPFPASPAPGSKKSGKSQKSKKSGKGTHTGTSRSGSSVSGSEVTGTGTQSGTGSESGEQDEEGSEEVDEEDEEEDEDEDEEELDDEHDFMSSEAHSPSSGRASGSMSSLGQPIAGSSTRFPFSVRRPVGVGHGRSMSGVSSGMSHSYSHSHSQSHSHSHSQSISSRGTRSGAMSVLTQSTGNVESTDSEDARSSGRERASLSLGSSQSGGFAPSIPRPPRTHMGALAGLAAGALPLPPRHPGGENRGRSRSMASASPSSGSTSSAAAAAALASVHPHMTMNVAPIAFPSVVHVPAGQRRRADSGVIGGAEARGVVVDPSYVYGETMSDFEADPAEVDRGEEEEVLEGEEPYEHQEHDDQIGLLGVPHTPSPRGSLLGGLGGRSRRSSAVSQHEEGSEQSSSRSRRSSARSRTQSYSSHGSGSPRQRASSLISLGSSMRAFVQGSMSQLDLVMRGATGPAAGLGSLGVSGGGTAGLGATTSSNGGGASGSRSRPRSRVNSAMDRVEEETANHGAPPLPLSPLGPSASATSRNRDASGGSSQSGGSGAESGSMSGRSHALEGVPMHPIVRRTRRDMEYEAGEGYASSAGTHSRSGSESVGGASVENWTFGRPIGYQHKAAAEEAAGSSTAHIRQLETQQEEDEALAERSREPSRRASPDHSGAATSGPIAIPARRPVSGPQSVSASMTESFYSAQTAGPMDRSPEHEHSPSPPQSHDSHSPERQGVDVPWNPQGFLAPPSAWNARAGPSRGRQAGAMASNTSIDMLSTAAGSFVTAPATIAGSTTATEGSGPGQATPRLGSSVGSWDTTHAAEGVVSAGRRVDNIGGMVERPGGDMGATGGAWRVV